MPTAASPQLPLTAASPFASLPDLIHAHAVRRPESPALADEHERLSYAQLDLWADRLALQLQRIGIKPGESVGLSAGNSVAAAAAFIGALRAGATVVPLPISAGPEAWSAMAHDAGVRVLFADGPGMQAPLPHATVLACASLQALGAALDAPGTDPAEPKAWQARPDDPFNIIYSSGTTGTPKGIVQPHGMRWSHVRRGMAFGYGPESRTLLSTPLYSNTTLVALTPTLGLGGCVHLMRRFDASRWLATAQRERITHTMLVPVQYQRLLDHPEFDRTDLSSFEMKLCTSAPFSAALKAEALKRWPGGLVEVYGMTEGGGACILEAHRHPDKLHTVGRPGDGHDIRLIDEQGRELPGPWNGHGPDAQTAWHVGEVVGRSPGMMSGYHGQPELTRQALWHDNQGRAYVRTGDVGRFDEDGFLILLDRRKDMIISGGFNLYPSDLEALLRSHPAVADAAVVGVPSRRWGETPVAWVVLDASVDTAPSAEALRAWFNERCPRLQRLAGLAWADELPRSAIGKVLKRELRQRWQDPVE